MPSPKKMNVRCMAILGSGALACMLAASAALAQAPSKMTTDPRGLTVNSPKMRTEIPASITTPDTVDTSLGTLRFFDGLPDDDTVRKVYDNLDLFRGVDVFLNTMSAASTLANIEGLKSVGCDMFSVVIHENRVDARTLLLTPNTQT